jgi:hypothetical protein
MEQSELEVVVEIPMSNSIAASNETEKRNTPDRGSLVLNRIITSLGPPPKVYGRS